MVNKAKNKILDFCNEAVKYLAGFAVGVVLTALLLDNRVGAMWKAFQYPEVINSATFTAEVTSKK